MEGAGRKRKATSNRRAAATTKTGSAGKRVPRKKEQNSSRDRFSTLEANLSQAKAFYLTLEGCSLEERIEHLKTQVRLLTLILVGLETQWRQVMIKKRGTLLVTSTSNLIQ